MTYPSYANAYAGETQEPGGGGSTPLTGPTGPASALTVAAPPGDTFGTGVVASPGPATSVLAAPAGEVYAANIDRSGAVLTVLAGDRVEVQPGTLYAQVGGGNSGGTVYFFLDSSPTFFASTYLDEVGAGEVWLPINGLTVGTHVLKASQTTAAPATGDDFYVAQAAPVDPPFTPYIPPLPPAAPINHWVFQAYDFSDPASVGSYTFEVNPDSVSQQFGSYVINSEATTVSNGQVISWEGSAQPAKWTWTGRVLTEAEYAALETWGTTKQRVYLTDHFRRRFLVKVESVSFQRVRDKDRPWHHTYSMEAYVLSGDGVG